MTEPTPPEDSPVTIERHEGLAVLTLSRPERRNAISRDLAEALVDRVGQAAADGARALVLTGEGAAFCAGGDLDDLAEVIDAGASSVARTVYGRFQRAVLALRESRIPAIAAVNGPAVGAGFDLALACHLRVASADAWFSSTWIKLGLITGMGATHRLTELVGPGRAAELTLTGRRLSSAEALSWGVVNRVAPVERLLEQALELAGEVSSHPADAVSETLASIRRSGSTTLRDELETLAAVQARLLTAEDFRAVLAARPGHGAPQ
jgi:2-(1,2-epoxy-1,2-dihydrophenyl)acetyl-CoA isomerase